MATMFAPDAPRSAASNTLNARSRIPARANRIPRRWLGTSAEASREDHPRVTARDRYVSTRLCHDPAHALEQGEPFMRRSSIAGAVAGLVVLAVALVAVPAGAQSSTTSGSTTN